MNIGLGWLYCIELKFWFSFQAIRLCSAFGGKLFEPETMEDIDPFLGNLVANEDDPYDGEFKLQSIFRIVMFEIPSVSRWV